SRSLPARDAHQPDIAERVRPLRSAKDVADEPGSLGVRRYVWNRRAIGGESTRSGAAPDTIAPTSPAAELPIASTRFSSGVSGIRAGSLQRTPGTRALDARRSGASDRAAPRTRSCRRR